MTSMFDEAAFLQALEDALSGKAPLRGEIIGRHKIGDYTVDTCYTLDCGWETAVCKGEGDWIVVARYETREQAQEGHEDWIYACGCFPTSAWSIQTERYEEF